MLHTSTLSHFRDSCSPGLPSLSAIAVWLHRAARPRPRALLPALPRPPRCRLPVCSRARAHRRCSRHFVLFGSVQGQLSRSVTPRLSITALGTAPSPRDGASPPHGLTDPGRSARSRQVNPLGVHVPHSTVLTSDGSPAWRSDARACSSRAPSTVHSIASVPRPPGHAHAAR